MQAGRSGENLRRPIARIVMQERTASRQLILAIRQPSAAATRIDVVLATDTQADAMTGRHDDRGRPDLHVERNNLAPLERLFLGVPVIRPVRLGKFFIERAM